MDIRSQSKVCIIGDETQRLSNVDTGSLIRIDPTQYEYNSVLPAIVINLFLNNSFV